MRRDQSQAKHDAYDNSLAVIFHNHHPRFILKDPIYE